MIKCTKTSYNLCILLFLYSVDIYRKICYDIYNKNKRIKEGKPTEPERKKDYDNRDYDERAFL